MSKLEPNAYPSLMDSLAFSADAIASMIKTYHLEFLPIKDKAVEWEMRFPMFLNAFYHWVYYKHQVPTQEQFFEHYCQMSMPQFVALSRAQLLALKARVYRCYPSLVRDLHFNYLLKEQLPAAKLWYNRKLDVEQGIDTLLQYNKQLYALNLYTQTRRGLVGRQKKVRRHRTLDNVVYLELPINLEDCNKFGAFYLYGIKECRAVAKLVGYGQAQTV